MRNAPLEMHTRPTWDWEDTLWRDYYQRIRTACNIDAIVTVMVILIAVVLQLLNYNEKTVLIGSWLFLFKVLAILIVLALNAWNYRQRRLSCEWHLALIGGGHYLSIVIAVTYLIHLSGGAASFYAFNYLLLAFVGSYFAPAQLIFPLAVIGSLCHGGMILMEEAGILQTYDKGLWVFNPDVGSHLAAFLAWGLFSSLTFLMVYFGRKLFAVFDAQRQDLYSIRQSLEKQVLERTDELSSALDTLQQEKARQERFFAQITHQFRTPIHVIKNFIANFQDGIYGPVSSKQIRALHQVAIGSQNLLNLINNLLDITKVRSGRMTLNTESFSLKDEITKLVESMQPLAESHRLTLQVRGLESLPTQMENDRGKINMVLMNLLHNAVKFSSDGEVRLLANLAEANDSIVIRVEDEGNGISAEQQKIIFEAFEQLHTISDIQGSGLGLYISRRFANMLGGSLKVNSTPGVGSVFIFDLPLSVPSSVSGEGG